MKKILNTKWFTLCTYFLLLAAILLIGFVFLQNNKTLNNVITSFFEVAENRSFDYRQSIKILHKQPLPNKDIVVLTIDDASLEILWDKYGEWPIPRSVYADMVNYIENDKPQAIIFDLLFVKPLRTEEISDKSLTNTLNSFDNIYVGINFDTVQADVRFPADLPERISAKLENSSKVDIKKKYTFANCRTILPELMNGKVHIGMTNVLRSDDGIIRKVAPLVVYKDNYYPFLAFKAGSDYITTEDIRSYKIDSDNNLKINDVSIPLNKYGEAILNWYGVSGTHTSYPMYKLLRDMKNPSDMNRMNFKDKIIIVGTTAMALHDTKSVPIQDSIYPGVEVHATFFNNMLDNNFIKQTDNLFNIILMIGLVLFVALIVMYSSSTIFAVLSTLLFALAYLFISYYVMDMFNLWIPVVLPVVVITASFAFTFIAKYLIKSRDFEHQYKLATTDGLTELYNHRYFQDMMKQQIEQCKRYNSKFSLIMIDIDYFKKFNDKFGHQAGDAVLKQVALILKKNTRISDYVCRYGGEEMAIILPNTAYEETLKNAERIRKAVEETPFKLSLTQEGQVTISLGIASYNGDDETAQDIIKRADNALYKAKENGRNQVGT